MKKKFKLVLCTLIVCMLCTCNATYVSAGKSEAEIRAQVVDTYVRANAMAGGRGFAHLCNHATHYQLKALGINYIGGNGLNWRGSAWYGNLSDSAVTPEGRMAM